MESGTRALIFSLKSETVEYLHSLLSSRKYQIKKAFSISDCEKIFIEYQPQVCIIDSDEELCSKLKSENSDSKFILLKSKEKPISHTQINKISADCFLEFPFSENSLLVNIDLLLNEKKERANLKKIIASIKESEEKYKRLFQLSPDGLGYYVGGKIGFMNEAGINILGADSIDEVFGKHFIDFVHPFDKIAFFDKTKNIPADKPLFFETRIVTLDKKIKYIDMALTPFLLGGNKAVQYIFRDITEKKLNEINLIESKTRVEFVQSIAKLAYWEYDIRSNTLLWSKDIFQIFGLSEKEFKPSFVNLISIIHPDERKIFQKSLDAALSGVVHLNMENRIIKPSGEIIFVNQRAAVTFDEKGNIIKLIGYVQDITERKQMENAIRDSQSRLAGIINSAMDAVITIDLKQNILLFNSAAEKMFRCSADDIIGKPLDRFVPSGIKEIHQAHVKNFSRTGVTMRAMGSISPLKALRADGEEFPMEASVSQVEVSGQKLFTVIIRDITEKKKAEDALITSEARYRLLFAQNPLPMWVYDYETLKFVAVNNAAVKNYGYTKEEFFSMTILDIRPAEDIPSLRNYLNSGREKYSNAGNWRHIKKDGTVIVAEVVSHEIEFDGRISRLVLSNDITNRKKAEDELKNSREQLRLLAAHLQSVREEERSAIAREIHDELAQVLTSLKMNLTFIIKKLTGDLPEINIPEMRKEMTGMTSVIDNTVKRIRKIITELRPEMLDQLGLIAALEWQVDEFKSKSGIDCRLLNSFENIEINRDISITVYRIFQEALTNVMRHSKATEVVLTIEKINNNLKLEISDNGIGFNPQKAKSKTFGVLGMQERVIILGGVFKIEPVEPSGTKIAVYIPLDVN